MTYKAKESKKKTEQRGGDTLGWSFLMWRKTKLQTLHDFKGQEALIRTCSEFWACSSEGTCAINSPEHRGSSFLATLQIVEKNVIRSWEQGTRQSGKQGKVGSYLRLRHFERRQR